jgi:hypothetical protein
MKTTTKIEGGFRISNGNKTAVEKPTKKISDWDTFIDIKGHCSLAVDIC